MFVLECPHCGARDQGEFTAGGEAHRARPDPDSADDEAWTAFLWMRHNTKGPHRERWLHAAGCGRWFNVVRSTASDRVFGSYRAGDPPPPLPEEGRPSPSGEAVGSGNDAVKLTGVSS